MGMVQQFEHLDLPIHFFQIDFVEFTFIDDFYGNLQKNWIYKQQTRIELGFVLMSKKKRFEVSWLYLDSLHEISGTFSVLIIEIFW